VFISEPETPAVPAPTTPVVSDSDFAAIVDEQATTFAREETVQAVSKPDTLVREEKGTESVELSEVLAIAPPTEPAPVEAEVTSNLDVAFGMVMEGVVAELATDAALGDPAPGDEEFLAVVEEMSASFAEDTTRLVAEGDELRQAEPSFEPLEVGDDIYSGEAYALNRGAEGIAAPATAPASEPENVDERLTNAVRLTREAVFAWASLLHGPAVVTISH
jgi:hypothetical protein